MTPRLFVQDARKMAKHGEHASSMVASKMAQRGKRTSLMVASQMAQRENPASLMNAQKMALCQCGKLASFVVVRKMA